MSLDPEIAGRSGGSVRFVTGMKPWVWTLAPARGCPARGGPALVIGDKVVESINGKVLWIHC